MEVKREGKERRDCYVCIINTVHVITIRSVNCHAHKSCGHILHALCNELILAAGLCARAHVIYRLGVNQ